eukprot:g1033.t1
MSGKYSLSENSACVRRQNTLLLSLGSRTQCQLVRIGNRSKIDAEALLANRGTSYALFLYRTGRAGLLLSGNGLTRVFKFFCKHCFIVGIH